MRARRRILRAMRHYLGLRGQLAVVATLDCIVDRGCC
jgi:hypothetical protein